jgi:hypothetical protein
MSITILDEQGVVYQGVLLTSTATAPALISEHPREVGTPITDNARPLLERLSVTIGASDAPIVGEQREGSAAAVYDALRAARDRSAILTVVTRTRTYPQVLIEEVKEPRASASYGGWSVDVSLVQLVTVQSATVTVPPEILALLRRASAKSKDKTQDAPKATASPAGRKSLAKGLAGAFAALGG